MYLTAGKVICGSNSHVIHALVDSGTAVNFLDETIWHGVYLSHSPNRPMECKSSWQHPTRRKKNSTLHYPSPDEHRYVASCLLTYHVPLSSLMTPSWYLLAPFNKLFSWTATCFKYCLYHVTQLLSKAINEWSPRRKPPCCHPNDPGTVLLSCLQALLPLEGVCTHFAFRNQNHRKVHCRSLGSRVHPIIIVTNHFLVCEKADLH